MDEREFLNELGMRDSEMREGTVKGNVETDSEIGTDVEVGPQLRIRKTYTNARGQAVEGPLFALSVDGSAEFYTTKEDLIDLLNVDVEASREAWEGVNGRDAGVHTIRTENDLRVVSLDEKGP